MASKDIESSQQQKQNVTIGTQGNEDQPTPLGDDMHHHKDSSKDDRHIPNQDKSSASGQERSGNRE